MRVGYESYSKEMTEKTKREHAVALLGIDRFPAKLLKDSRFNGIRDALGVDFKISNLLQFHYAVQTI